MLGVLEITCPAETEESFLSLTVFNCDPASGAFWVSDGDLETLLGGLGGGGECEMALKPGRERASRG